MDTDDVGGGVGGGGLGTLSFIVWPSYIAIATADENPHLVPTQRRAQLWWRTVCASCGRPTPCGDEKAGWTPTAPPKILGAAGGPNSQNSQGCWVPAGQYDKFVYFTTPDGPSCTFMFLAQPHIQLVDGFVVVDPVENNVPVTLDMSGVAR